MFVSLCEQILNTEHGLYLSCQPHKKRQTFVVLENRFSIESHDICWILQCWTTFLCFLLSIVIHCMDSFSCPTVHFIRTNSMPIWFLFRFERQKNRSEKTSFHITCCLDNENVTIDIVSQPFHILACNYSTCDYPAKYVKSTLNHIFNADSMNQSFDNQFFWHRIGCWIEN